MPEFRSYIDTNTDVPDSNHVNGRDLVAFSTASPEKERGNEDSLVWIAWPHSLLLAISDGVGGQPGGSEASRLTVQFLLDRFKNVNDDQIGLDVFRHGVLDAIEGANAALQDIGVGSGATVTVVTIADSQARVYSVGDSSTLICGAKGKVKFLNVPHSPTGYAVAAGVLSEHDALHHEERHLLSNLVGSPDMHIDIGPPIRLARRDRVLVASDGLWDNMYLDEIIGTVRKGTPVAAAISMQKTCKQRMQDSEGKLPSHADDLSFIVARCNTTGAESVVSAGASA